MFFYSNNDPARYRLRSATGTNYSVPRTMTKFGDRAFSVARPVVWNSLPARSSRGQSTLLNTDSNRTFLACVLMIDSVMPSGPVSRMEGTKLALLTYLLTYLLTSSSLLASSSVERCRTDDSMPNVPVSCLPPSRVDPEDVTPEI